MTATLNFSAPENCRDCLLSHDYVDSVALYGYQERYCYNDMVVTIYTTSRHPECPLIIHTTLQDLADEYGGTK